MVLVTTYSLIIKCDSDIRYQKRGCSYSLFYNLKLSLNGNGNFLLSVTDSSETSSNCQTEKSKVRFLHIAF